MTRISEPRKEEGATYLAKVRRYPYESGAESVITSGDYNKCINFVREYNDANATDAAYVEKFNPIRSRRFYEEVPAILKKIREDLDNE